MLISDLQPDYIKECNQNVYNFLNDFRYNSRMIDSNNELLLQNGISKLIYNHLKDVYIIRAGNTSHKVAGKHIGADKALLLFFQEI